MMPYFLLLEIWYVKYRVYLHNKAEAAKKKADAGAEAAERDEK